MSACAHLLYQLQPKVRKELGLSPKLASDTMQTVALSENGAHVRYSGGDVRGVGEGDAMAYRSFHRQMTRFADLLNTYLNMTPPRLGTGEFRDLIVHYEVRTPADIEEQIGITEGNIFHGELTMDQLLFNRPVPGYAQYRAPVPGLYMCGSSTHPGGGVMAAPGANAAREILADLNRPNTVPENFGDD